MKKILSILMIMFTIIGFIPTNVLAENLGNEIKLLESDDLRVRTFLIENGVNEENIDELINKYENGVVWDSLKQDSEPLDITTKEEGCKKIIKKTFNDGSVSVTEIQRENTGEEIIDPTKPVQYSVSDGRWESGSGYSNCYRAIVRRNHGIVDMSFKADFTLVQEKGKSYISDVYRGDYYVAGGVVTNENLRITRERQTSCHPAEAEYAIQFNLLKAGASWKYILWLEVKDYNYRDVHQFWEK